jgi:hypothetical protein
MPHDAAIMAGDQAVTLHQGKTAYPVLRHQHDDDIVAMRGPQLFQRAQFLRDIAALAAVLPAQRYMLNLCTDRYRFMVGFSTRWRKITLTSTRSPRRRTRCYRRWFIPISPAKSVPYQ